MIAVVDDGGNLIALERLDGSCAAGAAISIGKARTAAIFILHTRFLLLMSTAAGTCPGCGVSRLQPI